MNKLILKETGKDIISIYKRAYSILKNELNDLEHVHRELTKKQTRIKNGQERLRQNLRTVQHGSALGKRYLAKLNTEEDQIEQLESIIISTKSQVDAKRRELSTYIQNINL